MGTTHHVRDTKVKTRHPLGVVGLGIITLGLYTLYWWYAANRELRDIGGDGSPAVSVLAVTVGALVLVPPLVSNWNTADRIRRVQETAGSASPISPLLALVLLFVPVANVFQPAYLQSGLNQAWEHLTPGGADRGAAAADESA